MIFPLARPICGGPLPQRLLGVGLGDGGALDVGIHGNSVTVFLSHSEHNFLNDRLRWCAKSKSNRAVNAG